MPARTAISRSKVGAERAGDAVVVVHGARPGPVLAVASGAHGSEYASIIAVEKLIRALELFVFVYVTWGCITLILRW